MKCAIASGAPARMWSWKAAMSAPALKARPAPVITTLRTARSSSMRSRAFIRASNSSLLSAFSFSGRSSVRTATIPSSSYFITSGTVRLSCSRVAGATNTLSYAPPESFLDRRRSLEPNAMISRQPVGLLRNGRRTPSSELREAVAEGPVLFRGLENVHEHVLRPDTRAFAEQLRDAPEQRFFLFLGAGVEHGDL